ncbi:MAG: phosphoglucomutase/phosphomannomutase family protein [bacterium]
MAIKFGTDGWRAVISDEFTFQNVRIVAQAIASYVNDHKLAKRGIIVGYDTRFLAEHYAEEVVKVLHSNGILCYMTDRDTPTPVLAFSVKDKKAGGAIMITASHNPSQYCGIKFIPDYAGPASSAIMDEIEKNLNNHPQTKASLEIERFNPTNRYLKHLEEMVDLDAIRKAKLKVAYDPLWGTGRDYLDKILQKAGCEVIVIHGFRDVLFGGITPEPIGDHLKELKASVVKEKCSAGLATDPDADRFGVMDEKGDYISANRVISALFAYLVDERGESGSVVKSIATTHMINAIADNHGIKVHETPVGFKHIAQIMLKEPVVIGGEESGGLTIGDHIPEKDGILANLLICEMIARYKKPLSQIMKDISDKYGHFYDRRVNLKLTPSSKEALMKLLETEPLPRSAGAKLSHISKVDGVKMVFDDESWILARPSGTEPMIRVYYESSSERGLRDMILDFESFVSAAIGV